MTHRLFSIHRIRQLILVCWLLGGQLVTLPTIIWAQAETTSQAVAQLNRVRLENGLPPLAISAALERAAKRHSDDQSRGNFLDDTGSDGSTGKDRMIAAGYTTWANSRIIWGETLYVSTGGFAEVLDFIINDPTQRSILLTARFREIGIGLAGTDRQSWTILYAAQPNVLPAFINDGAGVTNDANVAVRLTQEEAVPAGEGDKTIGQAIEVRISTDPNMTGVAWRPWQPLLEFRFDLKPGPKTIYAQYRDASGRTVTSAASIRYDPNAANTIRPVGPGIRDITAIVATETSVPASPAPPTSVSPTRPGAPAATPTAVQIGNASPVATPNLPTLSTNVAKAARPDNETPTPVVYAVSAELTAENTSPASTVVSPQTPDIPVVETAGPRMFNRAAMQQSLESPVLSWLLPVYLVVQIGAIVLGLARWITRKNSIVTPYTNESAKSADQ